MSDRVWMTLVLLSLLVLVGLIASIDSWIGSGGRCIIRRFRPSQMCRSGGR